MLNSKYGSTSWIHESHCNFRDIVIPKSRAVQQRRMRAETSVDSDDDDAFFDSEDDEDDQDESK